MHRPRYHQSIYTPTTMALPLCTHHRGCASSTTHSLPCTNAGTSLTSLTPLPATSRRQDDVIQSYHAMLEMADPEKVSPTRDHQKSSLVHLLPRALCLVPPPILIPPTPRTTLFHSNVQAARIAWTDDGRVVLQEKQPLRRTRRHKAAQKKFAKVNLYQHIIHVVWIHVDFASSRIPYPRACFVFTVSCLALVIIRHILGPPSSPPRRSRRRGGSVTWRRRQSLFSKRTILTRGELATCR